MKYEKKKSLSSLFFSILNLMPHTFLAASQPNSFILILKPYLISSI